MNTDKQINLEPKTPASADNKVALLAELICEIIEAEDGSHE